MDEMFRAICKYPNGTKVTVELYDGGIVSGHIDTMYETDNGLELDDEGYEDFYAWLLRIENIEKHSSETKPFLIGGLWEFSKQNLPRRITLNTGEVIWELGVDE